MGDPLECTGERGCPQHQFWQMHEQCPSCHTPIDHEHTEDCPVRQKDRESEKRQAITEMMREVENGNAYVIEHSQTKEPLAIIVPWEYWQALKNDLKAQEES